MTTGSFTKDNLTVIPYYLNGGYAGLTTVGSYETKTWAGSDTAARLLRPPAIRRSYTTIDRRGKVVRKTFWARQPRRAIALPPHPYEMSSFRYVGKPGTIVIRNSYSGVPSPTQTVTDYVIPRDSVPFPSLPAWSSNDDIQLVNALREKVRGSDFNLAVMLGEGREALQMIGDSAIRIARAYSAVRKGDVFRAITYLSKSAKQTARLEVDARKLQHVHQVRRDASDRLSSNWLALQYGWLPLLADMRNGAEFLAHQLNVPFKKRYAVRRVLRNRPSQDGFSFKHADYTATAGKQIVAYVSESESIPKLSGLLDPEVVIWELTPFSFVADWFLPVGDWLEARAFASSLSGTFVTTTWTSRKVLGAVGGAFRVASNHVGSSEITGIDIRASQFSMNRAVSSSLSVPMPAVKPLSKALSFGHCVNAIALLAQVVKGKVIG